MTPQETIDYMENEIRCIQRARYCDRDCAKCHLVKEDKPLIEAFGKAINALEKQIPKKPKEKAQTGFDFEVARSLVCPCCNAPIVNVWSKAEYNPKFCHYCGQKLDWRRENDKL